MRFDREHVVWFRSPSPLDEYRSLAPLLPAMASAVLSLNAMSANAMIFENGLTGAGIVTPREGAAGLDDDGAIEVSKLLQRTLKGKKGFHRWLVMKFQNLEFQKLDLSPKDAQFVQALKLTREDVCNAMGVPLPIIQPTDTTFSNMRDAREALWSNLLLAERMRIQSAVFSQLVHRHFEGEADAFELDISQVPELRENEAERWKIEREKMNALVDLSLKVVTGEVGRDAAVKMAGRFIGLDEDVATACLPEAASDGRELNGAQVARAREIVLDVAAGQLPRETGVAMLGSFFNRPPEWAENVMGPVGDTFIVGVGAEPEPAALPGPEADGAGSPQDGQEPGAEAAEAGEGDSGTGEDAEGARGVLRRTVVVFEAGSQHVRDVSSIAPGSRMRATEYGGELHRAHMRKAEEVEERHLPDVLDAVRTLFRGQGESIMSGLADLTDEDLARIVDEVGDDPEDVADAIMDLVFDSQVWANRSLGRLVELYGDVAEDVGADLFDELGVDEAFDAEAPRVVAAVAERADLFATTTADTSRRKALEAIAGGLEDGLDLAGIVDEVQARVDGWTKGRAETAARTALHGTTQAVADEAARQSGVVAGKEWLTSLDERVRGTHKDAHGQTVGLDEDFEVGDGHGPSPGNIDADEENYNCRCVTRYITRSEA